MDGADPGLDTRSETRLTLMTQARKRFGKISEQLLVDHILQQMGEADWSTLKAALDALARRYSFAQRDALVLATPLRARQTLRAYRTRSQQRGQRSARPYETELLSLVPLRMSCSCADFVRSSLGLCKHCLVVLEALHVQRAHQAGQETASVTVKTPTLAWGSFQPPLGSNDRLERLRLLLPPRRRQLHG